MGGPLPITSSRIGHLWDGLSRAYEVLDFDAAAEGDEVFRCLVLARIIEPTSKLDSLRVLEEVGMRIPYVVAELRREHPGTAIADGQIFIQPWPAGHTDNRRDQVIYYQYKADRARRMLRGIDEQVAKAEKVVAGKVAGQAQPVHPTRWRHQRPSIVSWRPKRGGDQCQWPGVITVGCVQPDVLVVFGDGETEAVPAGLAEIGP